jgi:SAM-dependent methyltransferase
MWYLETLDRYGFIHSIFTIETLNLFACNCPSCGASDRDRLYGLYLKQKFANMDGTKKYKSIDFGPSAVLSKAIKKYPCLNYRSADLLADNVDDKVDIMNMPTYRDNSVDMFLCSHVLEHVEDDKKAIQELYRILKPGGWGIVMAPIVLTLRDIYEDASIKTEAERWKHFGQGEHHRIYSKQGFISRLEDAGFRVNQFGISYFGAGVFEKHGIHPRSVLYVVEKR